MSRLNPKFSKQNWVEPALLKFWETIRSGKSFPSAQRLLSASLLELWPHIKITFTKPPTNRHVSTPKNSIKCVVKWIPLSENCNFVIANPGTAGKGGYESRETEPPVCSVCLFSLAYYWLGKIDTLSRSVARENRHTEQIGTEIGESSCKITGLHCQPMEMYPRSTFLDRLVQCSCTGFARLV